MHLSKRHTAHNRKKLPPEHPINAESQNRSQQTRKRVPDNRGILFVRRIKTRTGRSPDFWLKEKWKPFTI